MSKEQQKERYNEYQQEHQHFDECRALILENTEKYEAEFEEDAGALQGDAGRRRGAVQSDDD